MKRVRRVNEWSGRDINEEHRVSSPLELFFDLTFAVSLAAVSLQLSRLLAEGYIVSPLLSFAISMLAICWAWMNYSWFASAYDTDDYTFRLATLVHMVGVIVLALGLPQLFQSVAEGVRLDNSVMVLGYIIMRLAMIFLWIRAGKYDRNRRRPLFTNAAVVFLAQILWTCLIFWKPHFREALLLLVAFGFFEFAGPVAFYRRWGTPPWHAHHIAERYSLLVIIALGECVSGAVAMVGAVVNGHGWSLEPILVGTACIGLAFGCWWLYFLRPFGEFLKGRRERAYSWGYLHILVFSSIVAMGSGLQLLGGLLEGRSKLSLETTLMFTVISVCAYISSVFTVNNFSLFPRKWIDFCLWCGSVLMAVTSLMVMKLGGSLPLCLGVLASAPFLVVVGYEAIDYRKRE